MTNLTTKAIIFSHHPYAIKELWGMTLTEKILRQLSAAGIEDCIVVSDEEAGFSSHLREDFSSWHSINIKNVNSGESEAATLMAILREDPSSFLVLRGNTILDARILDLLIKKGRQGESLQVETGSKQVPAFVLNRESVNSDGLSGSLTEFLDKVKLTRTSTSEMDTYISSMRRRMEPFLFEITHDEELKKAERVAFNSIYKGATDFITKYVWPLPTRFMVHLLGPTNITPNQITYVSMILSFGAIPFFFMGWFWPAWIMGTIMSFLDTLDGKLARLTLRTSESGHWLDNASDTIYLWLWYAGIGWYFSSDLFDFQEINTLACWALVGFFTIDKIITGLFKKLFGAQLHDFAPIDWHARIYIARRNPFLVVLLIGLIMNQPAFGLHAMAVWQTATFAFHMTRFIYLPLTSQKHQVHTR